ncbi:DUF6517 family protein [Halobacteriales archaeon Cl-PHB]
MAEISHTANARYVTSIKILAFPNYHLLITMTNEESGAFFKGDWQIHRRRFLTGAAAVAVGGAAGCSSLTNQEFEAQPIVLPEGAREELVLGETARDSSTVTRETDAIDGEISITSFSAAYSRGKAYDLEGADYAPRLSLLGRYLQQVNGTNGPGAAAVAAASDVGIDEVTVGDFAVDGNRVSMVAPAGLRDGQGASGNPGLFSLMYPPEVSPEIWNEIMNPDSGTNGAFLVNATDFFPTRRFDTEGLQPGTYSEAAQAWMPAGYTGAEDLMDGGKVMIALDPALTPEDVFGVSAEEMPGERVESGEELARATGNNPFLVAAPNTVTFGNQSPVAAVFRFFNTAVPTWTGGATYGVGVLATPAATVAGQSVNPVADMSFEELLTSDQASGLLRQAAGSAADSVEWDPGPAPVGEVTLGPSLDEGMPDSTTILDDETDLKSFLGVVSGEDGPWGVGVHMARVENEHDDGTDVVVTAAVHRWPVGSADNVGWIDGDADERFTGILGSIITEARALAAATVERYVPGDANMS